MAGAGRLVCEVSSSQGAILNNPLQLRRDIDRHHNPFYYVKVNVKTRECSLFALVSSLYLPKRHVSHSQDSRA